MEYRIELDINFFSTSYNEQNSALLVGRKVKKLPLASIKPQITLCPFDLAGLRVPIMQLPSFADAFEFENNFYLSCNVNRMSKVLAHYESFKMVTELPGEIVECGVFKGASFARFAMMREILGNPFGKRLIGFDSFGPFPDTQHEADRAFLDQWTSEAGNQSISVEDLQKVLDHKGCLRNVELIAGDINQTVPEYVHDHPELRIALLNLDTDVYEPAVTILEQFWPIVVHGGVVLLDDYGVFPGETKAVDEFFADQRITIKRFPFAKTPSYVIKS